MRSNESMKLKVNKISTVIAALYACITLNVLWIALVLESRETGYCVLSILTIVHFMIALLLIKSEGQKIISVSGIFIVFLYVFHTGQLIVYSLFKNYKYAKTNYIEYTGKNLFFYSSIISILVITMIVVGIIIGDKIFIKTQNSVWLGKKATISNRKLKIVGWFIVLTTFPFHFKVAYNQIILAMQGNYFDVFEYQISGILYAYTQFFLIGVSLLMVAYAKKKWKLTSIYLTTVLYFCWTMLAGSRGRAVIAIVFFTLLYLKLIGITVIKLIPFVIVGYIGLIGLSIISVARDSGGITLAVLMEGFKSAGSPILRILEEFGGTQYTVALSVREVPSNVSYQGGSSYILSLMSVLPNIGGVLAEVNNRALFYSQYFQDYMGGSIIAELYTNFGYLFPVPAMIIGIFVGKLSNIFEKAIQKKVYVVIPFLALLINGIMWWVRDSVASIIRNPIWGYFYLVILFKIYDEIYRGKYNEKCVNNNWSVTDGGSRKNNSRFC